MSQDNVEIVRRQQEAWQRDDFEGWLCLLDPEIEWLW
jgi:ketosteroid isomerase-like protein